MGLTHYQTEGIVLHTTPFKEYDKILTLFTPRMGLLKLFAKGSKQGFFAQNGLTSPLTIGEYLFTQGREGLHNLRDGAILSQNLALRNKLETLQAAEKLVQALYKSQWPGKSAPKLYSLLRLFLEKLPCTEDPQTLSSAFLLKILKHEGQFQHNPSQGQTCRYGGECYTPDLAPFGALFLSAEEENSLFFMLNCRSLQRLLSLSISTELASKIDILFEQVFS